MQILVAVSEKAYFQRLHHLARLRFIQQEGRHGNNGETVIRNALRKIKFRKNSRRKEKRDQVVDDSNGCSRRWYEQKRQNDGHRNRPPAGQKERSRQNKGSKFDSQQIGGRRVVDDSFPEPSKNRGPMADQLAQLIAAFIDQEKPHVARVTNRFKRRLPRQIDCLLGDLGLGLARAASHLGY